MLERTLNRDFYLSREIFARERERVFAREWVLVARDEDVSSPGDYLVVDVAGESILLVRGRDAALRGFYNVCRHRGSQLVLDDPDATRSNDGSACGSFGSGIKCPYHAWTYTLEGALRTAPFLEEDVDIQKADLGLHQVSVDTWGGFVFVRLVGEGHAPTLRAQLGDAAERVRRYPLAELRTGRQFMYEVEANWKVILENYNECYHCGPVHPELCRVVPAFRTRGGGELDWERGIPHREGAWTFTASGTSERAPFEGLDEDERVRHKGELIYPNFMLSLSAEHVTAYRVRPRSPSHTTIVCDLLFHPSEMAKARFDPTDAADFWDLVNRQDWKICEGVQRGMQSRVFDHGYYAPMESASLDIRRYIGDRLGVDPLAPRVE